MNETMTEESLNDKPHEQIIAANEQRQTQLITLQQQELAIRKERFEFLKNEAVTLSKSTLVPKEYQGNPANGMIALEQANRLRMNALAVMQSMHIINGRPSWSSKFLAALVNSCGLFTPLEYNFVGEEGTDSWGCFASACNIDSGRIVKGVTVTIKMAKEEGWYQKAGSKWKTMPELMLQYRAASMFANVHVPEIALGMQTDDEARDSATPKQISRSFDSLVVEVTPSEKSDVIDVEIE